jgi:hypothetical protein
MAEKPIIFALANPEPEIGYPQAKQVRPDAIVATGRSDYPNQVNNVLCFPFLFRGALDVRATQSMTHEGGGCSCVSGIGEKMCLIPSSRLRRSAYSFGPNTLFRNL